MKTKTLQYTVLTVGTIVFSLLIYGLVLIEKRKISLNNEYRIDFNYQSTVKTQVYSKPNKNSLIIEIISANTKVITTKSTKFYFKVIKIDGYKNIMDGYISKQDLRKLK